jgi:NADH:ubiquinone oxidoreductase subunit E
VTWGADTLKRASDLIARYPQKRSAVMPLLYMAMKEDGRLTDDGMRQVAELTGLTPAQVQSVASFYVMYKTEAQGHYLVSVCSSISCFLLGADEILHAVEQAAGVPAGEADDEIGVEHAECIGACGGAPACLVNFELVEGLTPEKAGEMIEWLASTGRSRRRTAPSARSRLSRFSVPRPTTQMPSNPAALVPPLGGRCRRR